MKIKMKISAILVSVVLIFIGCDPVESENPQGGDDNPPIEQPDDTDDENPDDGKPDEPTEKPITDGSIFNIQINDDIMAIVGTNTWNAIACGNGRYVAVGSDGQIAYSTNGTSWTSKIVGSSNYSWQKVIYVNNRFVAAFAGNLGTIYNPEYCLVVATSTNGETWNILPTVSGNGVVSIAYGNGMYAIMDGNGKLYTLSDSGQNLVRVNNYPLTSGNVLYAKGKFYFIAYEKLCTSADCKTFSGVQTISNSRAYNFLGYNESNKAFIANDASQPSAPYVSTDDCITWNPIFEERNVMLFSTSKDASIAVLGKNNTPNEQYLISFDLKTWETYYFDEPTILNCICII